MFATLRGALFAIGDEELLEWKQRFGATRFGIFHPVPRCRAPTVPPRTWRQSRDALRVLQRLHRRRNYRPVAETIQELLDATRAHVGFVLRSAGEQALANVLHVAELARQYEAGGGISFRGFVDELRDRRRERAGGRGADPRRGQRRRPDDDRAQGQGARVSRS